MSNKRYWQLDLLKGVGVLLMIGWHFSFDLVNLVRTTDYFGYWYWRIGPEVISGIFLFSSGIGTYLRSVRVKTNDSYFPVSFKFGWHVGARIFFVGILLSLITRFGTQDYIIFFGILHLIGFCILVSPLFVGLPKKLLFSLALILLIGGYIFESSVYYSEFKFWLQVIFFKRVMLDFYLPLPSLGYFLLGIAFAPDLLRYFSKDTKMINVKWMSFLGKHSLIVYLVHQPLLIGILYLFGFQIRGPG
ncbi:MAG: DUF1624 domain-containing protein [Bdellovibrionales bacterium]|nr:DUF1624 domain-containing protein [Bdellovibrionales bacterium]